MGGAPFSFSLSRLLLLNILHVAAVLRAHGGHEVVLVRVRSALAVGGVLFENGHEVVAGETIVGNQLGARNVHIAALASFVVREIFRGLLNGGFAGFGMRGGSQKKGGENESLGHEESPGLGYAGRNL